MKALVQRVKRASVEIEEKLYSQIGQGMLILLKALFPNWARNVDFAWCGKG